MSHVERRWVRPVTCLAVVSLLILGGCSGGGGGGEGGGSSTPSLSGTVEGGTAPVTGAAVTLYAVGSAYGTGATNLGTATTDSNGDFTITYTRPSSAAILYIVALGGDAGGGANSALGLLGVVGLSDALPQSVTINELTTVSAEWALAQFTDATGQVVGAPSTNVNGLTNAVFDAQANLADIASGGPAAFWNSNGVDEASCTGGSPPINCDGLERMDTLANILASCIESSGPGSTNCDILFALTGSSTTTLQAAHYLAIHPITQPDDLFPLQAESPPFSPALAAAPSDGWEIALNLPLAGVSFEDDNTIDLAIDATGNVWLPTGAGNSVIELTSSGALAGNFAPAGANFNSPEGVAIDAAGNIWVPSVNGNSVTELTSSGGLAGYFDNSNTSGANFNEPQNVAFDATGNAWLSNWNGNSVTELTSHGDLIGNYAPVAANFDQPLGVAIDATGNAWVSNFNGNTVTELNSSGDVIGNFAPVGANFDNPWGVAADNSGNTWISNGSGSSVTELTSGGGLAGNYDPAGSNFTSPFGVAIDSAANVWVTNLNGGSVTELSAAGNLAGFFDPSGAGFNGPQALAIDSAGNVWVLNNTGHSVSEMIGLAGAVLTPQVACLKQSPPHAVCLP